MIMIITFFIIFFQEAPQAAILLHERVKFAARFAVPCCSIGHAIGHGTSPETAKLSPQDLSSHGIARLVCGGYLRHRAGSARSDGHSSQNGGAATSCKIISQGADPGQGRLRRAIMDAWHVERIVACGTQGWDLSAFQSASGPRTVTGECMYLVGCLTKTAVTRVSRFSPLTRSRLPAHRRPRRRRSRRPARTARQSGPRCRRAGSL